MAGLSARLDGRTALCWLRRDLRLTDNAALYTTLRTHSQVLVVFIFDQYILGQLEERSDARVTFMHFELSKLKAELEAAGSSLFVLYGRPEELFSKLRPAHLFAAEDYDPYSRKRDEQIKQLVEGYGGSFNLVTDHVLHHPESIVKDTGSPYTVFTPYARKWRLAAAKIAIPQYASEQLLHRLKKVDPQSMLSLADIGFKSSSITYPAGKVETKQLAGYAAQRDYPATEGTTRLGVHLRFGTISVRKLIKEALAHSDAFLNELIWREFYQMILWYFPHVAERSFKRQYDGIPWQNNEEFFGRWCQGQTGYPLVDAGMRQLNATGYMHNRVRMVVASFLCKHLLIDWRWGEAYFAARLLDYELASNNGGWQWAAGCGCDAAPYFRVFNPTLQQKKFDPLGIYVGRWVPEWKTSAYAKPIIDHETARRRALDVYRRALTS